MFANLASVLVHTGAVSFLQKNDTAHLQHKVPTLMTFYIVSKQ